MKIAIASGKGGTGKTTLAVNLASYAAQKEPVFLADLDVEEPNSGIFIRGKLVLKKTIAKMVPNWQEDACIQCGKCTDYCRFHSLIRLGRTFLVLPELCHSCYACSELCPTHALPMQEFPIGELTHYETENLQFVQGKMKIGAEQAVPVIDQCLTYLSKIETAASLQIIDSPPGTSCPMIASTKSADYVFLVTEPTPFGLHDLKLAVETMRLLEKPFSVIVNRNGIGNKDVFDYCDKNDIHLLTVIPNLRTIAEYYSQGKLLYHTIPEFSNAMATMYDFIQEKRSYLCGK